MDYSQREALSAFLAQQAGANSVQVTGARRLAGGAIQENWLIEADFDGGQVAGAQRLVLRCDAPSGVSLSHGRAQEFALLRSAFDAGVCVPEPLWVGEDSSLLGRQFLVMRYVEGAAAAHLIVRPDSSYAPDRVGLVTRLGRELARIHSINPTDAGLDFLQRYDESPAQHQLNKLRGFLDAHPVPYPSLEWGLRWLERNAPPRGEFRLCHRDFRTGNYLLDARGLAGILDWEFAGWSDPLEDIGWFCARCWRFGRPDLEAGGIGSRDDFYRGYEAESGRRIERRQVAYWEVMAHMNWAMISIQQAERHLSGQESSLLLALTAHITPELELEILEMTRED